MVDIVEGRMCGDCTVCCVVPPIDSPAFKKPSGILCRHCAETEGCRIHASRPEVCRDFFCGWRSLSLFDDRWRPDRCGLLIASETQDIPAPFARRVGLKVIAFRSEADLLQPFVIDMLAGLVFAEAPVFLSVPGPPNHFFAKTLLNPGLREPAARRDGETMRERLVEAYRGLAEGPFEAVL